MTALIWWDGRSWHTIGRGKWLTARRGHNPRKIEALVRQMTLEEKVSLAAGAESVETAPIGG
jgi:hypothetical protein